MQRFTYALRWFRRPRQALAGILTSVLVGLLAAQPAVAQDLSQGVILIVGNILLAIIAAVGGLTALAMHVIVIVSQHNEFINVPVVKTGWAIVRDITNMFFIVGMLVIAAGTILRIENYRYNRLLARLVIMAFLVNFSRLIAGFFIQAAQVVMLTFANSYKDAFFGNLANMFGLTDVLQFAAQNQGGIVQNTVCGSQNLFAVVISMLAGAAMMVTALIVTLAIAVILIIRIVALWILIILSPLAYALRILPNTENQASRWWKEFGKYVTVGPVLAFILWLSLAIIVSTGTRSSHNLLGSQANRTSAENSATQFCSNILQLDKFSGFLVGIIFLLMGLKYATDSGVVGAKIAANAATGVGLGVTGAAWLRDRTIAPVQGWIANRQSARRAAIQERTETLEAAGDRARAAIGRTRAGRALEQAPIIGAGVRRGTERSQAGAQWFERQRSTRYAQERGMDNWSIDQFNRELNSAMSDSSADGRRRRIAMVQTMQSRGLLNREIPLHDAAMERYALDTRMGGEDKRKFQVQVAQSHAQTMEDEDQIRARIAAAKDPEEQLIYLRRLEQRRAGRAENPADVALYNSVRANLARLPQSLKAWDDSLKKSNPEMALQTIFNGLGESATSRAGAEADIQRYLSDVQEGLMRTRPLTAERQARIQNHLTNLARNEGATPAVASDYGRNYLARNIVYGARTKDELDRALNDMDNESTTALLDGARLDYADASGVHTLDEERQQLLADRHFYEEAFTRMTPTGTDAVDESALRKYAAVNENKIKEGYETMAISNSTLDNDRIMGILDNLDSINEEAVGKLTKDSRKRGIYGRMKLDQIESLKAGGADFSTTTATGRSNLKQLRLLSVAGQGGKLRNRSNTEVQSLEAAFAPAPRVAVAANPDIDKQLQEAFEKFVRTSGDKLTRMDFSDFKSNPKFQETIVNNINVRDLTSIHDKNTQSVIDILKKMQADFAGMPPTDPRYARLKNILDDRIPKNDTLSSYV